MNKVLANRLAIGILILVFVAFFVALIVNIPTRQPQVMARPVVPGGVAEMAPAAIGKYGCGSCHNIPGIDGANGTVGPLLAHFSERSLLAGELPNTPENLILWIQHPQQVHPGTDMPEMGVTDQDARNIAAYLYSIP
jgi:cytochrome c2